MLEAIRGMPEGRRLALAVACLGIAAAIGTMTFQRTGLFSFLSGPRAVSFAPDLISAVLAILVVLPILRGRMTRTHRNDALSLIGLALLFYLVAVISKMAIGGTGSGFARLTETPTALFALAVLLLANWNIGRYGSLAVMGLIILGGWNMVAASKVMGLWGFFFAIASVAGLALLLDFERVIGTLRPGPVPEPVGSHHPRTMLEE
jgi:hypothetical protein